MPYDDRQIGFLSAARGLPSYEGWNDDEISSNINEVLMSGDSTRIGGLTSALTGLPNYEGWQPPEIQSNITEIFQQPEAIQTEMPLEPSPYMPALEPPEAETTGVAPEFAEVETELFREPKGGITTPFKAGISSIIGGAKSLYTTSKFVAEQKIKRDEFYEDPEAGKEYTEFMYGDEATKKKFIENKRAQEKYLAEEAIKRAEEVIPQLEKTLPPEWEEEIRAAASGTLNPLKNPTEAMLSWATNIADQTRFFVSHAGGPAMGFAIASSSIGEEYLEMGRANGLTDDEIYENFKEATNIASALEYGSELATLGILKKVPGVKKLTKPLQQFLGKHIVGKVVGAMGAPVLEGLTEWTQQGVFNYYLGKTAKGAGWTEDDVKKKFANENILKSRDFWIGFGTSGVISGGARTVEKLGEVSRAKQEAIEKGEWIPEGFVKTEEGKIVSKEFVEKGLPAIKEEIAAVSPEEQKIRHEKYEAEKAGEEAPPIKKGEEPKAVRFERRQPTEKELAKLPQPVEQAKTEEIEKEVKPKPKKETLPPLKEEIKEAVEPEKPVEKKPLVKKKPAKLPYPELKKLAKKLKIPAFDPIHEGLKGGWTEEKLRKAVTIAQGLEKKKPAEEKPMLAKEITEPAVFYRGTVPGETKKIEPIFEIQKEGKPFVAKKIESARMYGKDITKFIAKEDAKILYEGSSEYRKITRRIGKDILTQRRKGESHIEAVNSVIKQAKDAGYDAVSFNRDSDIGTVVLNEDAFTKEKYKETEKPFLKKQIDPTTFKESITEVTARKEFPAIMEKVAPIKESDSYTDRGQKIMFKKEDKGAVSYKNGWFHITIKKSLPPNEKASTYIHEIAHIGAPNVLKQNPKVHKRISSLWKLDQKNNRVKNIREAYKGESEDVIFTEWLVHNIEQHRMNPKKQGLTYQVVKLVREFFTNMGVIKADLDDMLNKMVKEMRKLTKVEKDILAKPELAKERKIKDVKGEVVAKVAFAKEYVGTHEAPHRDDDYAKPAHDLTDIYPDDVYSAQGARYYGHGDVAMDNQSIAIMRRLKGKPNAIVTIYRAVPKVLTAQERIDDIEKEEKTGINDGDWVTINRQYAKEHGEGHLDRYKILSKQVRAKEIYSDGNSIHEWGYAPVKAEKEAVIGEGQPMFKKAPKKPKPTPPEPTTMLAKDISSKKTEETKEMKQAVDKTKKAENQLKESYEKQKDVWFGEKDVRVHKSMVEKRGLQKEIKGALKQKKYNELAKRYDKAIQIYIDLKRNPDDLKTFYEKLTPEQKNLVDLSQKLPDNVKEIADKIDKSYKETGVEALDAELIKNVLDNYVGRIWDLGDKPSTETLRRFGTRTRHAKGRKFATIIEGMAAGYDLKVKGATNNLQILKQEIIKTIEDKKFLKRLMKLKSIDGESLISTTKEEGYIRIEHPNFTTWKYAGEAEKDKVYGRNFFVDKDGNLFEKRELYAPKKFAKNLNNILGTSKLLGVPGVKAATKYNAIMKAWILQTSLFHHLAFMRSYELGTLGKKFGELSPRQAYKQGIKAIEEESPVVEHLVRNGLTLGLKQDWNEDLLREKTIIGKVLDKTGATKAVKDKIIKLREAQADFLFGEFGAGLKAKAAMIEYRNLQRKHPNMDADQLAKMAANLINDDFGGLHLQRMGRNPTLQHIFRLFALAPDWTESNIRSMVKMVGAGTKQERAMYRKFWAGIAAKGVILTALANALLSIGSDDPDDEYFRKLKRSWREGGLKFLDVDITRLYKALGGKSTDRKYFSILGHFKDPIKFATHPARSAQHKSSVLYKTFHEALTGVDWAGRRFTTFPELAGVDYEKGRYRTTKYGIHKKGESKAGKLAGKTVTWTPGKKGAVTYERMPSFLLTQLKGTQPVQVQNLISWASGEMEGFDALMNSMGLGVRTTYGGEESYAAENIQRLQKIQAEYQHANRTGDTEKAKKLKAKHNKEIEYMQKGAEKKEGKLKFTDSDFDRDRKSLKHQQDLLKKFEKANNQQRAQQTQIKIDTISRKINQMAGG